MPSELPHWLVYFGCDDLDASLAAVERLGGARLSDIVDMGSGRLAAVKDPQGAAFALFCGEMNE